jgi:CheY-like chemotaxis protein
MAAFCFVQRQRGRWSEEINMMNAQSGATIVVAEDTPDIRDVVELILEELGYDVVSVPNGERCLEIVQRCRPCLVLMDLSMPRLDGWEATRRLKADHATSNIPVLAFTAHVQECELNDARQAGCAGVITKPFEIDDLLRMITEVIHDAPLPSVA